MATRNGSSTGAKGSAGTPESIQDRHGPIEVPNLDQLPYAEVDRIKRVTGLDVFTAKPGKRLALLEWSARTRAGQPVSLEDIYNNGSMAGWLKVAAASTEDDGDEEGEEPPDPTQTPTG